MPARVPVIAVLVAHDGSRWLPDVLTALHAQTVTPARVVAVDTGSTDDSAALLRRATGNVLELERATGFPAAVAAGLSSVPADTRWVWLLHDDAAPDPDALSALLRAAASSPSAAVLGPKVVAWQDPRSLLEIGLTTDGSGVRDPCVDPGEQDQGQHDSPRDVLAVGTAGALVRRDVWDALGGLDHELPVFRSGLDLGWRANAAGHRVVVVPSARVRHARAAASGLRALPARPHAVDRAAALHVLLAHAAGWRAAAVLPRLVLACLLRALLLLLGRRPRTALDELAALHRVLTRPRALLAARRRSATTRTVAPRELRPLMSSPSRRAQARLAALVDRRRDRPVPGLDDPPPRAGAAGRARRSPALLLTGVLLLLALLASRSLIGAGVLVGGRLLPAPDSVAALREAYAATAEPLLAVLGLLSAVLLGRPGAAVDLLLLGLVPLSGAVAYAVAGRVVRGRLLRLWAAAAWALLPVATGAVAAGRLEAAVVHLSLPPLLLAGHRLTRTDPRRDGWWRAWALGLALAAVAAVSPLLWLLAGLLLVGVALARTAAAAPAVRPVARRRVLACLLAAAVPALLLLPWSPGLLAPARLLHGPGRLGPDLADPALPAWHLLLLQPGGPGTAPLLATLGLGLAALAALLRTRRAPVVAAGWGLALLGLALALVLARTRVAGVPVWPGVPLDLAAAGMLLAAAVGAEGLTTSLTRSAFGLRQLAAVLTVVLAALVPVVSALSWVVRGADGPLERAERDVLPAFAQAELAATPGLSALLLGARADGVVGYALSGPGGSVLGARPVEADAQVRALLSAPDPDAAASLAGRGVAFVSLAGNDRSSPVAQALDAQPGLSRLPGSGPALWRVEPPATPDVRSDTDPFPLPLVLQPLALLVVAVLAGPGSGPRRGAEPERRA